MYTTSGRLGSFKRSMVNEPAAPAEGYYLEGDLGQPAQLGRLETDSRAQSARAQMPNGASPQPAKSYARDFGIGERLTNLPRCGRPASPPTGACSAPRNSATTRSPEPPPWP